MRPVLCAHFHRSLFRSFRASVYVCQTGRSSSSRRSNGREQSERDLALAAAAVAAAAALYWQLTSPTCEWREISASSSFGGGGGVVVADDSEQGGENCVQRAPHSHSLSLARSLYANNLELSQARATRSMGEQTAAAAAEFAFPRCRRSSSPQPPPPPLSFGGSRAPELRLPMEVKKGDPKAPPELLARTSSVRCREQCTSRARALALPQPLPVALLLPLYLVLSCSTEAGQSARRIRAAYSQAALEQQ